MSASSMTQDADGGGTTVTLRPFQTYRFSTSNGTQMVLSLVNLSRDNLASFAAASTPIGFSDAGSLPPLGQKTYPPTDYQGNPLGVANTTNPNKPAKIRVFLGQLAVLARERGDRKRPL